MEKMKEIIDVAVYAGKIMVESGSEIYRCEDVIIRIAKHFGIKELDIFTLSTCLFVTCNEDGETYTCIKRMKPNDLNLTKISKVNQLSRDLVKNNFSLEEFNLFLKEIEVAKDQYSKLYTAIFSAIACACIGGTINDGTVVDFLSIVGISAVNYYLLDFLSRNRVNILAKNIIVSLSITFLAILVTKLQIVSNIDNIIIGSIILLVPGVMVTNAVRDAINGDVLSGFIRCIEAVMVATGMAIGVGVGLFFYINGLAG